MERRAISGAELAKLERLAALGRELCARLAVHLAKVQHQARECQPLMRVTYIQEAEALESLLLASGLKQVYDTQYQTLRAGWRLGEDLVIVPPVVDQRPEPQPAPAQVQPTSVPATPAASPAATTATSRAVKPSPEKVDSWASLRAKLDKGALLEARPPSSGNSLWPIGINSLQSASQLASKAPLYVRFKNFYYPVPQERWSEAYRIALLILMSKLTPEACVLCLQQNGFLMGSKVELYIKAPYRTPVLGVRPGLYLPIYNQPQQILANLRALSTALGKNPGDLSFYCLEAAASQPAPKAKTLPAAIAAANAANSTATTAKAGQGVVDVSNLDLSQTMISLGGGISVAPAAQPKTQSVPPARPTPPARSTLPTQSAPPIQSAPPAQAPPPGRSLPQVQPSPGAGGDPERELAEIMGLVGGSQGVMEEIKAPEKVEPTTTARPKADLGSLRPTALGIGFDRVTVSPPTWPQLYVNFVRWLYEKKLASNVTALYRHEADWGIVVTASAAGMAKDHPGKAYIVLADCAYLLLESEPQRVVDTLSKCCRALGLRPQLYYAPREAAPQEGAWLLEEGLKIHLAPGLSPEEEPGVGEVKAAPPSGPRWLQIGGEGIEITPPSWAELLHRFVGWLLVHTSLGERPLEDLYNRCHLALTRSSAEMEGRYPGHKYVAIDSDLYLLLYEDQASVLDAIKACARYLGISFERIAISNHLPQPAPTPAAPVESSPPVDSVVDASIKEAEPEFETEPAMESEPVSEMASEVEAEPEVWPEVEADVEPAAEVDPGLEPEPAPEAEPILEAKPAQTKGPLARGKLGVVRCRAVSWGPLGEALRQVALEQSGGILMGDRLGYKKFLHKVRANYGGHAQRDALLALSEEGYRDLLERCGLPLESAEGVSYYFYYPQLEKRLEKILEEARQRDWRVFNLERLGARHNLEELNLRQVELWPSLLERLNLPGRLITKTTKGQKEYFYTLEPQEKNLERLLLGEVRAHWGGESLLTLPQLQERLPYLGEADIKLAIGKGEELVLNETSTASRCASYLNLNYFELPPEEVERILEQVKTDLQKNGVFNLRDLPIDDLRYLADSRMTDIGWQNAIYVKYLSAACQRQGSTFFISWHGEKTVFSETVLEGRFRTVDGIVKYSQLVEWTKELTGKTFPYSTQKAAYNVLVRLDKDNWAADKEVDFCVEEIDSILEQKIGLFSSLKMLPSDLLYILPSCGHPWSLSLIESFCHRFSKKFRLLVPNGSCYNSQNIGIIAQASCDANYDELVIQALQKGGVGHNLQEIRDFLEEGGYFGTVYDATLKRFFGVV